MRCFQARPARASARWPSLLVDRHDLARYKHSTTLRDAAQPAGPAFRTQSLSTFAPPAQKLAVTTRRLHNEACGSAAAELEGGAWGRPESARDLAPLRCLSIVTGASRGLGAQLARTLAENGPPLSKADLPPVSTVSTCAAAAGHSRQSSVRNGYRKWHHDLVLLASDASRLDAFVQRELQPILDGSRLASATRGSGPSSSASGASGGGGSGGSSSAAAVGGASGGVTRVSTLAFDLGDLTSLESNAARLTAAAGASSAAGAAAAVAGSGGGGGGGGLLAAAPAAYSHVLLIHNAGQVGDLLPLEHQSLANMRRQTDLNVTSFTYLTAAVLRAFLPGHVDDSPDAAAPLRAATPAAQPDAPSPCPPASTTSSPSAPGPSGCPDAFTSQTSVSTGTSSDTCSPQEASDASASPPQHGHTGVRRRRRLITVVNISSVSVDQPYEHFSLYGMGKAARHMIVRSIAHEADLRERGDGAAAAAAAGNGSGAEAAESYKAAAEEEEEEARPWARVRALSYAPGAIDTEMQASAREALPPGRLKSAFEANQRAGRLVDPTTTSRVLYDILSNLDPYGNLDPQHYGVPYSNGFHLDYYTAVTGGRAAHPLASSAAASDAADAAESAQEPPAGIAEEAGPGQTAGAGQAGPGEEAVNVEVVGAVGRERT